MDEVAKDAHAQRERQRERNLVQHLLFLTSAYFSIRQHASAYVSMRHARTRSGNGSEEGIFSWTRGPAITDPSSLYQVPAKALLRRY
jgi:hypothetical protein